MNTDTTYKHLEFRPGGVARQPYVKGIKIRADTLYSALLESIDDDGGVEPGRTPEQIAADWNLPLEVVREAIDWCQKHYDVVLADRARENRLAAAYGMDHPDYKYNPNKYLKSITPAERRRILNDEDIS